jgi:hypothetical protein
MEQSDGQIECYNHHGRAVLQCHTSFRACSVVRTSDLSESTNHTQIVIMM